jgi:hypothetical protein
MIIFFDEGFSYCSCDRNNCIMALGIVVACHKTKRKITIGEQRLRRGIKGDILPDCYKFYFTESYSSSLIDVHVFFF